MKNLYTAIESQLFTSNITGRRMIRVFARSNNGDRLTKAYPAYDDKSPDERAPEYHDHLVKRWMKHNAIQWTTEPVCRTESGFIHRITDF